MAEGNFGFGLAVFCINPPTLLLWSLILMMGSFFLRSHTTAFPLGLAEARMCWTCLFQDTTLTSSAGWRKRQWLLLSKQTWLHPDIQMIILHGLCMQTGLWYLFKWEKAADGDAGSGYSWLCLIGTWSLYEGNVPCDETSITNGSYTHNKWNGNHKQNFVGAFTLNSQKWKYKHKETRRKLPVGDCGFYFVFWLKE